MKPAYMQGTNRERRYADSFQEYLNDIEPYVIRVEYESSRYTVLEVANREIRNAFIEKYRDRICVEEDEYIPYLDDTKDGSTLIAVVSDWYHAREKCKNENLSFHSS